MNEGPERIDYRETSDITEVHGAIKREHRDPSADVTPIPLWLTGVCGIAVCWAFAYLGVFHGGFSGKVYNEYESSPSVLFPSDSNKVAPVVATETLAQQGKKLYSNCASCHQGNGIGVAGIYPPLVKSEFVVMGEKRLLAILLKGLQGPLKVSGVQYPGTQNMPAWDSLTNKKIAAIATYIRAEWGNSGGEITEEDVAAARKEFGSKAGSWTEAELLKIPEDANYDGAATPAATKTPAAASAAPTVAATAAGGDQLALGKQTYTAVCMACHQATGLGMAPVFPPLVNSEYVGGDPRRLAAMILKGVTGPLTVEGKPFVGLMPGQETALNDEKIAATLTYVRASFGNNYPPVAPEVVAAVRKEHAGRTAPWTEEELKAFGQAAGATVN